MEFKPLLHRIVICSVVISFFLSRSHTLDCFFFFLFTVTPSCCEFPVAQSLMSRFHNATNNCVACRQIIQTDWTICNRLLAVLAPRFLSTTPISNQAVLCFSPRFFRVTTNSNSFKNVNFTVVLSEKICVQSLFLPAPKKK